VRFDWPAQLTDRDMRDMVELMNMVAVREKTLGFSEPLDGGAGLALMRTLEVELRRGTSHLLVARDLDDRIVGMVTLAHNALPARRHIIEMRRCVIHPDHRGVFLRDGWLVALRKTREVGCDLIVLEVREDGPEKLWRRLGFRDYGLLEDYARVDGRAIAGHFMYTYVDEALDALG
jgi:ribosomal protein S18 acetylase RimI-like enzyme